MEEMSETKLFSDLCAIVETTKRKTAVAVNRGIVFMYWHIGHRINTDVLGNKRAEYGKRIVAELATQLNEHFQTKEFSSRNLHRMMQFAADFQDVEIVSALATQLTWSHIIEILPLKSTVQKEFYLTMASKEMWGTKTLRAKIDGMLFERTAISGKPEEFIKKELTELRETNNLTPDLVFKNPYFLDFTGLKGFYSERDLEDRLVTKIQQFLMELGNGFCFVERQKRIIIDGEDYYIDLLFFHRKLRRLIAVELKLGRFKAAYKGQMELYLRWLDKYERQENEESPLGLFLCSDGGDEQIELLQLDQSGIRVAQYLTEFPSKELLQQHLRHQIESDNDNSAETDLIGDNK